MNLFGISSLILSLSGLVFSLIIFHSDTKNKLNRYWFASCMAYSVWGFSLYYVTTTSSYAAALGWQYVLDVSAIFIPVLIFLFISEFLKYNNHRIRTTALLVAFAFSIVSFLPSFKSSMDYLSYGFFWIHPGPIYISFPIYFAVYTTICSIILIRSYFKTQPNTVLRGQIRNILLATCIGALGGLTDFFPQIFKIYPFGNYLVIFYIVFIVYGVLRYKLFSAKVISAQLFSTALILTCLFILLRSNQLSDWIINFGVLVFVIFFSLLLVNSVNNEVKARQKIETLAKDLESANARLIELDGQKSEFVSLASHQLRGPLTAIKGYASLILEGDFGEISDTVRDGVDKIFKSTQALVVLVGDYLDVSRIEQGRMQYDFSIFNLKELVSSVLGELKPNIEAAHLDLTFDFDVNDTYIVNADQGKIKQIISNMIDNSTKYTKKGWIKVAIAKHVDTKKIVISIQDTGVGIKPEVLPLLFEKFTRAPDASKTNIMGTGLGLYVARKIIEAHPGGRIWAESPGQDKGSTFFIELSAA